MIKELKDYMSTAPILSAPEYGKDLFLYLVVSEVAVSAVLVREENKKQKPVFLQEKNATRYRNEVQ